MRSDALTIREHILAVLSGSGALGLTFQPFGKKIDEVWNDKILVSGVERILEGGLDCLVVEGSLVDPASGWTTYFRYRIVPGEKAL